MNEIYNFIFRHFFLIFGLALLWKVAAIGWRLVRRNKSGIVWPKRDDANVGFAERFASGASDKSFLTRIGGASNCLTVIVTDSSLAIRLLFPFSIFAESADLEHLIPLSRIVNIAPKSRVIEVVFLMADDTRRKVSLRLRDPAGFLQAIGKSSASEAGAPKLGNDAT
jgi:hypothetical protein